MKVKRTVWLSGKETYTLLEYTDAEYADMRASQDRNDYITNHAEIVGTEYEGGNMTSIDDLPEKGPDEPRPNDGPQEDQTGGHQEQQYPSAREENPEAVEGAGSGEPDEVVNDPANQQAAEEIRRSTTDQP